MDRITTDTKGAPIYLGDILKYGKDSRWVMGQIVQCDHKYKGDFMIVVTAASQDAIDTWGAYVGKHYYGIGRDVSFHWDNITSPDWWTTWMP